MKLEQINEQAKLSLKKYFKDAYEINHQEGLKKELSYNEMLDMIHTDIAKQQQRLQELNMMKSVLEHDAKKVYEYIFGAVKEQNEIHHDTIDEMRKKLNENMNAQMTYVNELKQQSMNK
ncbi:hypothetical protein H6A03_10275 [[Clostridium] spiroforme]|nr:hypothetical protein [Thomasclavelia spiroformis]MBM6880369.1 hypothetical protein [Thomasclavelia spiroformis]MBM6931344.1 hypothetical protein [Thomasclavelia spiroformis]